MHARVQWLSPSPLWDELYSAADTAPFRRPALLRFAADTFMEDLQAVLAKTPQQLRNFIARYENWRQPQSGLDAPATQTLRMYQPVHRRFYLVAASLGCQVPGLPDHTVLLPEKEAVTFVLRRQNENKEYAWIAGDPTTGWAETSPTQLAPGEEQLPMFPFQYTAKGLTRRIWAGLVPVTRKQSYANAQIVAPLDPADPTPAEDVRVTEWTRAASTPWRLLIQTNDPKIDASVASAFILIDLATYLKDRLPPVWGAINGASPKLGASQQAFVDTLQTTKDRSKRTLAAAIVEAYNNRAAIETNPQMGKLPDNYTKFYLTDVSPNKLDQLIEPALEETGPAPTSGVRVPSKEPEDPAAADNYVIRCVYTRPQCGPGAAPDISNPTEAFQLVGFFDPDAPARSLHVELPIDVRPQTLRKFDRNVAFTISGQLQKQLDRIPSLKDLAEGNINPEGGGLTLGWICSLSIPIITICAFILLLVIVIALNLVFFWMPFFKICFPVPKLKETT